MIGTYDKDYTANIMTASWVGIVNSNPPMISVSLRKATHSYESIINRRSFTISLPSVKHLLEVDYVGTKSGKQEPKFERTGLTPIKGEYVDAPYISEFPVVLECELIKYDDLGLHTMFIGKIIDVKVEDHCLDENNMPIIKNIDPIAYAHGKREYFRVGNYLGKANRLWQNTKLNSQVNKDEIREITELVYGYYDKLDKGEDISSFDECIDWKSVKIINGESIIYSQEGYNKWYCEVVDTMFNREHIIEDIKLIKIDVLTYQVEIDMYFTANTWEKGQPRFETTIVTGKVKWIAKRESLNKKFMLSNCLIEVV